MKCDCMFLFAAIAIALTMAVGTSVLLFTGAPMAAIVACMIMLVGSSWAGMVPFWVVIVFGLMGFSMMYVLRRW